MTQKFKGAKLKPGDLGIVTKSTNAWKSDALAGYEYSKSLDKGELFTVIEVSSILIPTYVSATSDELPIAQYRILTASGVVCWIRSDAVKRA